MNKEILRALGKVEEAEAIEATLKKETFPDTTAQSTDLNLFNQGVKFSNIWDYKM